MRVTLVWLLFAWAAITLAKAAELVPQRLREAAEYSRARRGLALLVEQGDRVLFEDYKGSASEPHKIYSGTKAFWVLDGLVAVKEGILSLDDKVSETIAEWKGDPLKEKIRVRQLLDFTDGIDPGSFLHADGIADRNSLAIQLPVVAEPGARFLYGPSHLQIFGELLRRKLASRGITPYSYLTSKVLVPLGLGHVEHKVDALGHPLLATGFKLTARQWARMGSLILHHGSYNGHAILPAALLEQCFQPSKANPAFGMGFWLNREACHSFAREPDIENMLEQKWYQPKWDNVCLCRAAPADMVVSLGSGYQRLYVIPSLDLVIVRQGIDAKFSDAEFLRILLGR